MSHASSIHKVERDFDYYTAVDDKGAGESGADVIRRVESNSATFYRYAVIDPHKIVANLQDDCELALDGVEAFVEANAWAIPTRKQNAFAAHSPPRFIA